MTEVHDNPDRHRYDITVDGDLAGFTVYHRRGNRIIFAHTEIDEAHEGKGLGSALIKAALDDAKGQGLRVVPLCPFVASYLERHPEYDDLVDHAMLEALDRHD